LLQANKAQQALHSLHNDSKCFTVSFTSLLVVLYQSWLHSTSLTISVSQLTACSSKFSFQDQSPTPENQIS